MKRALLAAFLALMFLPAAALAAKADSTKALGSFGLWRAYQSVERGQPVCYMTLTAHFQPGKKTKRNDALLTITHRPAENSKDVISYMAGYTYKSGSSVDMHIGKDSYSLFTAQDTAWSRDAATDHKIAAALQSGSAISLTGTPAWKNATPLTDKFPLKGTADAYQAISKACGIPVATKPAAKPTAKPAKKSPKKS